MALVPANFLATTPYVQLAHLPRYLKALLTRMERAALSPMKDQERMRQLAPYLDVLQKSRANATASPEACRQLENFRWMVEEFKVSLFAQELGTAHPVSAKRLDAVPWARYCVACQEQIAARVAQGEREEEFEESER